MRAIDDIMRDRTCYKFLNKPVSQELLVKIYDTMKLGSTSGNGCPLRIVFVQGESAKEKLYAAVAKSNIPKIQSAPVVALFAYDMKFYKKMERLHPTAKVLRESLAATSEAMLEIEALRNSSLQAAYFMMIARGVGLDCGPMSGFNHQVLNENFFKDTDYRINFICNLGYKDGENPYPRLPRLDFDEVCEIL